MTVNNLYAPHGTAGTFGRELAGKVRWLRGRALVLRDRSEMALHRRASGLIVPQRAKDREEELEIHRGTVLALGPPGTLGDKGPTVPWGVEIGNDVVFTFGLALQKFRSFDDGDGGELVVVAQDEIHAAIS